MESIYNYYENGITEYWCPSYINEKLDDKSYKDDSFDEEYISPKYDVAFKHLFGNNNNKDILQAFLSDVLDLPCDEFDKIELADPQNNRQYKNDKFTVLDVKVRTKTGVNIDIEIQYDKVGAFVPRMVYYMCRLFDGQLQGSDKYHKLNKAICIVIADFSFIDKPNYHGRYMLHDNENSDTLTDLLQVHTLELPKVPRKRDNAIWDWMSFFKAKTKEDFEMVSKNNNGVKKAVEELHLFSADEIAREQAFQEKKARMDAYEFKRSALEEGRTRGMAEGKAEGKAETAKKLKEMNVDINIIIESTGLSKEEIEKL